MATRGIIEPVAKLAEIYRKEERNEFVKENITVLQSITTHTVHDTSLSLYGASLAHGCIHRAWSNSNKAPYKIETLGTDLYRRLCALQHG